jgi:glyoxylase-like metal-dependent hydrolase (beta-lactamase superfamily II)
MRPDVKPFRHESTGTWSYVVVDPATRKSAIVDPVLDFDAKSGQSTVTSATAISDFVRAESLTNEWILETHAHADHSERSTLAAGRRRRADRDRPGHPRSAAHVS